MKLFIKLFCESAWSVIKFLMIPILSCFTIFKAMPYIIENMGIANFFIGMGIVSFFAIVGAIMWDKYDKLKQKPKGE